MMRLIRLMLFLGGAMCLVIVLGELAVVALLWQQGHLNSRTIAEVKMALSGQSIIDIPTAETKDTPVNPSAEDIRDARVMRVLNLEAREKELNVIKEAVALSMNQLIQEQDTFDRLKKTFREELTKQGEAVQSEATEQARAVLLASPPEVAASRLMELSLEESIVLVKGMPEKQIARILQQFVGTPDREKRGTEIFEALANGDPQKALLNGTQQALAPDKNNSGGI